MMRMTTMKRLSSLLLLLSTALLFADAWVPKTIRPVDRLFVTRLDEQRRFAQPNTENKKERKNNYGADSERKNNYGADSKIASAHKERIRTAGRVGTKRFVDPCKVFIGNLPFDTDGDQLGQFVLNTMGQSRLAMHSSKVIYDWKTGKSKGYGFMIFTDPIYATLCMDVVSGIRLNGRAVTVDQGKKKDQENQLYLKKKRTAPVSDEDAAIASALEEAESDEEDDIRVFGDGDDEDLELDAALFGLMSDDEDDDDYDGIFLERKPIYEDMDPNLNREQRREAARSFKKQKLPHKGFGKVH